MRWLKAELHSHCDLDPVDYRICDYSAEDLIREAARLEYEILAITCHNLDVWNPKLDEFAASHGITLIPAMEVVTRAHKHVLVYNFRTGSDQLDTLSKIAAQKKQDTLVVAPHPYYPSRSCLWRQLENNLELFDAVELSGFFTARLDFNQQARRIAEKHGKAVIGASDAHYLWQLGRTFTRVFAEPGIPSILEAIRAGRVKVEAAPLSFGEVLSWWGSSLWRAITNARAHPGTFYIHSAGFGSVLARFGSRAGTQRNGNRPDGDFRPRHAFSRAGQAQDRAPNRQQSAPRRWV